MLERLENIDKDLLLQAQSFHSDFWDRFMAFITNKYVSVPLYILLVVLVIITFRKKSLLIFLLIGLMITCSDRISSGFFKPTFKRLRPCHDAEIARLVRMPAGCGGTYGFVSSHAANTFALAGFLFLLGRKRSRWYALLFVWAVLVSYSRVYLGIHYPGDVIVGGLLGLLLGSIFYLIYLKTEPLLFKRSAKKY